tara:strand:- start:25 stop:531 length:507 start_codon:yes stop_codon:yes gene_type:complete
MTSGIEVMIEIPMGSDPVKYEVYTKTGQIYLDRFLDTAMFYPTNYGFIPNTMSSDGDPIDVCVVSPYPLIHGCIARCRVLGMLDMTDQNGHDPKLIAVPMDRLYADWLDIGDVPTILKNQIKHFFTHYKDLEIEGWTEVGEWRTSLQARLYISESEQKEQNLLTRWSV